ncbi:MAG TPA: cyclic nucleotide-binding domain-containing protein [Polyangia bacterium]|jgi:CRP-like cAMP-binding protein
MPAVETTGPRELTRGLSAAHAEALLGLGERVAVASGAPLFALGADADRLYLVERGRIALTLPITVRGADQDIFVEEKAAGETVGWSALVPPHRFTLSARAIAEAELLALPRAPLLALLAAEPALGFAVMSNMAAVIGRRLLKLQTMWVREVQRVVDARFGAS